MPGPFLRRWQLTGGSVLSRLNNQTETTKIGLNGARKLLPSAARPAREWQPGSPTHASVFRICLRRK
jgi:hypothetical protein